MSRLKGSGNFELGRTEKLACTGERFSDSEVVVPYGVYNEVQCLRMKIDG